MSRLLTEFYNTPWAIIPDRMAQIRAVLQRWDSGIKLTKDEIAAAVGDSPRAAALRRAQSSPKGIGVLPILGILAQRRAGDVSTPGTATDTVRRHFAEMASDDSIESIVLDIDSPGGSVFGIQELAADIYAGRERKRIVAVANSLAASAAYWIASAADELVVTPGGAVGSIGVFTAHEDHSGALAQKGIDVTLISAGKYKVEGNPFGPLGDEARAALQETVNDYYNAFVNGVAENRGIGTLSVRNGYGMGRTVGATRALQEGMVDRIEPFDQTLNRLMHR